eukprot:5122650-Prymnesium_polylepis.1
MTESSKPPSWDGQPTTLARHLVKLEEDYAEHVSASPFSGISPRDGRGGRARQDLRLFAVSYCWQDAGRTLAGRN